MRQRGIHQGEAGAPVQLGQCAPRQFLGRLGDWLTDPRLLARDQLCPEHRRLGIEAGEIAGDMKGIRRSEGGEC